MMNTDRIIINDAIRDLAEHSSEDALRTLYLAYYSKLKVFVEYYVMSETDVDEVISNTFLSVWMNRKDLPGIVNFDTYLFRIAKFKAVSNFRSELRSRKPFVQNVPATIERASTDNTPETDIISSETIRRLDEAVESLPPKCKLVFQMVRYDKLKYKEVAEILGISVKTVENHITHAIARLRKTLTEE